MQVLGHARPSCTGVMVGLMGALTGPGCTEALGEAE